MSYPHQDQDQNNYQQMSYLIGDFMTSLKPCVVIWMTSCMFQVGSMATLEMEKYSNTTHLHQATDTWTITGVVTFSKNERQSSTVKIYADQMLVCGFSLLSPAAVADGDAGSTCAVTVGQTRGQVGQFRLTVRVPARLTHSRAVVRVETDPGDVIMTEVGELPPVYFGSQDRVRRQAQQHPPGWDQDKEDHEDLIRLVVYVLCIWTGMALFLGITGCKLRHKKYSFRDFANLLKRQQTSTSEESGVSSTSSERKRKLTDRVFKWQRKNESINSQSMRDKQSSLYDSIEEGSGSEKKSASSSQRKPGSGQSGMTDLYDDISGSNPRSGSTSGSM